MNELGLFSIYNPYSNINVTDFYVKIIEQAIEKCGIQTERIDKLKRVKDEKGILIVHPKDYIKAKAAGYKLIFLWVQGLIPEESYMRNNNIFRKYILSAEELPGLIGSDLIFMVSERMMKHYSMKYKINFNNKVFFMPCFNTEIKEYSFFTENKYKKNIFAYTGGLAVWQCFEEITQIYKDIEDNISDAEFHVYTAEKEKAKNILVANGIKKFNIDYLSSNELDARLQHVKFGFVIREDTEVNRVSTPTKISTYMSNGVIPIFSDCIDDFSRVSKNMKYVIPLSDFKSDKILEFIQKDIDPLEIKTEYQEFFEQYYNKEKYTSDIFELIKKKLEENKCKE